MRDMRLVPIILFSLSFAGFAQQPSDKNTEPQPSGANTEQSFASAGKVEMHLRGGDYEIYVIHPDGTGLKRLTRSPGNDAHASFSPDGEWIAFATARGGFKDEAMLQQGNFQPYGEIGVMRANGSDFHLLTDDAIEEGVPTWVGR